MIFRNGSIEDFLNIIDDGIVVFGTSNIAMTLMEDVGRLGKCNRILYFVDNDRSLWGQTIQMQEREYRIEEPKYLEKETRNIRVVIASTYIYDIARQLEGYASLNERGCWFYIFMRWRPDYDLEGYLEKIDCSHKKYLAQTEQFRNMKDCHKGETCFIVGNGPSLTMEDLELLKGKFCFGANQIFLAFDRTSWRPDVYLTVNADTILAYRREIEGLDCALKFIDSKALDYGVEIHDALYLKHGVFAAGDDFFSSDISRYYYNGGTVVYTAMQVAAYMGFEDIYLIGVDNNYSLEKKRNGNTVRNDIQNHFYKDEDDRKSAKLYSMVDVDHLSQSFLTAKKYAEKNGIRIFNATRGGKLEVFPRVRLESIV